jgi:hypothetical protein
VLGTTIGGWEVLGGLLGTAAILNLFGEISNTAAAKTLFALILGMCAFSIVAGAMLLLGVSAGRPLSLIVQGVQILQFSFGWCRFELLIGPRLQLGLLEGWRPAAFFTTLPSFHLGIGGWSVPYCAINLFALASLIFLVEFWKPKAAPPHERPAIDTQ